MAKINDTPIDSSPSKKPSEKERAPVKSTNDAHQPKKRRKKHLYTFTMIIVMVMVGTALLLTYKNFQTQQGAKRQMQLLLSQMSSLKNQQMATKRHMEQTINHINESQDTLKIQLAHLDKNLHTALQQNLYQTKDWLLLKARYYLELAQINTQWSDDLQSTNTLLQQADTLLADFHDDSAVKVRQAIANEIAQIEATPKPDLAGLLHQLDAAQTQIANLPMKTSEGISQKTGSNTSQKQPSQGWRGHLQQTVSLLEQLVVIRHHDADIVPPPSIVYESMIREGIRLNLQEAQWAALQNNEVIYQFSLSQALKNIKHSFNLEQPNTVALVKQLEGFQQVQLAPKKLSLNQSLPLLNQWIESNESQQLSAPGEHAQ